MKVEPNFETKTYTFSDVQPMEFAKFLCLVRTVCENGYVTPEQQEELRKYYDEINCSVSKMQENFRKQN
ncbi:MAG: hypothetical protein FWH18_10955 [Marinilabiliaceae bacterium]|nr:hypothetical protein [Marinilabiliaceae bacterium]